MWKPDESLDDYNVAPASDVVPDPPNSVSLQRTGEVEILKPLTRPEIRARSARKAFRSFRPVVVDQPLWFRRFVAVGSGALVITALVLVSAILVGIEDSSVRTEVATGGMPEFNLTQSEERALYDVTSPSSFAPVTFVGEISPTATKRRASSPRVERVSHRPRRSAPSLRIAEPKFVPTTLIIYAENGVIKKRIEPWLQSS